MKTGTSATRATVHATWDPILRDAGAYGEELGMQILAVAHEIAINPLREPLTDPGRDAQDKSDLARRLFAGRCDERVCELLCSMVAHRWSQATDLVSALHDFGIEAILSGARADGHLDSVEQELFSIDRVLRANRELRVAMDPSRTRNTEDRVTLARSVFAPHISRPAMELLVWCVRHYADGGVPYNLRRVAQLAAAMQNRAIADVTTAVPLSPQQEQRLRDALRARLGTEVELSADVDPDVIGGVRIRVRDLVIDNTTRSELASLRNALVG